MAYNTKHKYRSRRKKRNRWPIGTFLVLFAVAVAFLISYHGGAGILPSWAELYQKTGLSNASPAARPAADAAEATQIHFIDVGQGDSVLIEQNGEFGMIDCGTEECATALLSYLDQAGVKELKVLVMTHPHADHIGSMDAVMRHVQVDTLVLPQLDLATEYPSSAALEHVLDAAEEKNISTVTAETGQSYAIGSGSLSVIGTGLAGDNCNNISVCTMFTEGDFCFLDTGDGEKEEEDALLQSGQNLSASVFKAAHHGSRTANTEAFLRAVHPQAVVVSCGQNNDYGHPHREAMRSYATVGAAVYRTDQMGTVVAGYAPESGVTFYTAKADAEGANAA